MPPLTDLLIWSRRYVYGLAAAVLLLAVTAVMAGYYIHYAHAIDAQITGGPFRDSINIYGARIQKIESDGHEVKTLAPGYPLLENLSAGREKRRMVTFQDLPPILVNAIVSAEDKHFFHHTGLDLPRVAKAAYVDIREHRKEQGASTLTMQLVRGLWLEPKKSWNRKIAEAMMTVHLEHKWSKQEILGAYANLVFLGKQAAYNIHGFAEGSQLFFDKDIHDLNLPEAALLAGMVQRPSYFNPYRNPEHAKARRDLVLSLMLENKYITAGEYQRAIATPLMVVKPSDHDDPFGAPYFLDMVSDELQSIDQPDDGAKNIYTTIDLNLQRAAREALRDGMSEVDKLLAKRTGKSGVKAEAALIALDPHTGEIKALVGGRDYSRSQLNRIFAKRPPGSVFKPFVYAAALNTGLAGGDNVLTPASMVNDDPTTFVSGNQIYQPANFRQELFGSLTLRQALAKSDNIAAVKVAQMAGYPKVVAMARAAGLNDEIQPTPAVALGAYAVTPLEMAGAYTVFANGGTWVKPRILDRVENAAGITIHVEDTQSRLALDPRVAYLMTSMLEEVMRSGTAAGVRSRGFTVPAAGKTGTSHDGWFAGYTSQLLCIVWVGFDDYRELNLEGARSALPIWTEFMKKALRMGAYGTAHEFARPGGLRSARICLESGQLAGDFCLKTAGEFFIAGTEPREVCTLHAAPAQ